MEFWGIANLSIKIFWKIKKIRRDKSEKSKGAIHLVKINDFLFGYIIGEEDTLSFEEGNLILNERQRVPLYVNERRILDSLGIFRSGDELIIGYGGVGGEIEGHNSTLKPKNASKYCFSNVCMRDYISL